MNENVIFLYIDESGNYDFSNNGTEWFIISGVVLRRPFNAALSLLAFKYDCLENGIEVDRFHASEDTDFVRSEVYSRIALHGTNCHAYGAKVRKSLIPEEMRNPAKIYALAFSWLIREISRKENLENVAKVIVITDRLSNETKRKDIEKPLKACMKRHFQERGISYTLLHRRSESDQNLQIADYVCWAIQRHELKGLDWPYSKIENMMQAVSEVTII